MLKVAHQQIPTQCPIFFLPQHSCLQFECNTCNVKDEIDQYMIYQHNDIVCHNLFKVVHRLIWCPISFLPCIPAYT